LGLGVKIDKIPNPRRESEAHYYHPVHTGLRELGLNPHYLSRAGLVEMLQLVRRHRERIDSSLILPRVTWR
jgi:UDP-sulfoquinovose synthase